MNCTIEVARVIPVRGAGRGWYLPPRHATKDTSYQGRINLLKGVWVWPALANGHNREGVGALDRSKGQEGDTCP